MSGGHVLLTGDNVTPNAQLAYSNAHPWCFHFYQHHPPSNFHTWGTRYQLRSKKHSHNL